MSYMNDLKFLSKVKLYIDKTLTPKYVVNIRDHLINTASDLISIINGYNVLQCIQRTIKIDDLPLSDAIYENLMKCWFEDLIKTARLIGVSEGLSQIINIYMTHYALNAFFYSLLCKEIPQYPVLHEVSEAVQKSETVDNVVREFNKMRTPGLKNLSQLLTAYSGLKLRDLNLYNVYNELQRKVWSMLSDLFRDVPGAVKCISCIMKYGLLAAEIRKTGNASVLANFHLSEKAISDISSNPFLLELFFHLASLTCCNRALAFEPLTKGTLLRYLLLKEWESLFISYLLTLLNLGYRGEYIRSKLGDVVRVYEFLTE